MKLLSDNAPGRWLDLLGLLLIQALLLQNFPLHVDLHIADEVMYQRLGLGLLRGVVEDDFLLFAPLYVVAYGLLQILPLHGALVQDVMGVLVLTGSTLAVWWAVSAFVPRGFALFAAVWWASSHAVVAHPLKIYIFNATFCFLAVGLAGRGRMAAGLGVLALACCNRAEIALWVVGAALGLAWIGSRRGDLRLRRIGVLFAALGAGLVGVLLLLPGARERSWLAFRLNYPSYHFTAPSATGTDLPVPGGSAQANAIVDAAFPGADSVLSAFTTNPTEFGEHVWRNIEDLDDNLVDRLIAKPFYWTPVVQSACLRLALLGSALGLLALLLSRGRERAGPPVARWWFLSTSLLVLPSVLLIYPRFEYLMTLAPLILVVGAHLSHQGFTMLGRALRVPAPRELSLCLLLAVMIALGGPFVQKPADPDRRGREIVALLQRSEIPEGALLCAPHGAALLTLAGKSARTVETEDVFGVPPTGTDAAALAALDYILLTEWDYFPPYRDILLAELTTDRWTLVDSSYYSWLFRRAGGG